MILTTYLYSDLPPKPVETIHIKPKAPTGAIEFRDDIDLIEQVTALYFSA